MPENATLSLSWDGASMAPWSTARWTLTGTGTDSVYMERQRDDNDCGSRIETSLSLDLSFTDGGFVSLGGRAMGSLDDGPQFRALGVVLSQTDLSAEMQEALIDNLYARNPQGTFDEDWRAWTLQGWWFHLEGTPESGTAQILGALSAADMPQNRVFARARWTIAP